MPIRYVLLLDVQVGSTLLFVCFLWFFWFFVNFLKNKFHLFIYLFRLRWVFVAASGPSLVVGSGGYSLLRCAGFSLQWLLLLQSMRSRHTGFSSCSKKAQYLWLAGPRTRGLQQLRRMGSIVVARRLQQLQRAGSRAQAQQLWCTDLVASWHVGSSRTTAPPGKSLDLFLNLYLYQIFLCHSIKQLDVFHHVAHSNLLSHLHLMDTWLVSNLS